MNFNIMKPDRPLNIAVCISTQSRTWATGVPSLLSFFSSPIHKYHFLGHTWDKNSWKPGYHREYTIEQLNIDELRQSMLSKIPFTALRIDEQHDRPYTMAHNDETFYTWLPMLKSFMLSNNLKTQYEIENDMTFDLVVHTRWDLAYHPGTKFDNFIPREIVPDELYCYRSYFPAEYRMPFIDDIIYFGSSRTLDIIDSFYHYYSTNKFFEMTSVSQYNNAFYHVGVGVLLYKWATLKNIKFNELKTERLEGLYPAVIRQPVAGAQWPEEHDKIVHAYRTY